MAYVSETDFHGQTLTHLRNTSLNWGGDNLKGLTRGGGISWFIRESRKGMGIT